MIKNIIIATVLIAAGYIAAVFFPMPESIKQDFSSFIGQASSDVQEVKQGLEQDAHSVIGEIDSQGDATSGTLAASTPVTEESAEDEQEYFTQSDLLFNSHALNEKATIILGTFPNEQVANEEIASLNLKEPTNKFPFKSPTGTKVTLVTIGEFELEGEAYKAKLALESKHDLNLLIVKFPTKEEAPPKADEEIVDAVIEALKGSKQ